MNLMIVYDTWFEQFWSAFAEKFIEEIKIGNIGEQINEGILQWQGYFRIGDWKLLLTDAVIVMWIATILAIILFKWLTGRETLRPNAKQTVMWMLADLIISTCEGFGMKRKEAETVAPMVGTIAIIIAGCNVISTFKIAPPAKNIAFPVAMAVFTILYVIAIGIHFVGFKGFWASLTTPMAYLLPFKVLDFIIKPISLSLRLFGNVFGAFVFMEFLYIVIPVVVPGVFGLWFDIADGILQAIVFSYLTMSYIGEICEAGHELEEKESGKKERKKKKIDDSAVAA
ncbi:F-type H+-transporting ATPase subunit a [Ruminococcaceae bacterium YRB3002]|nr:F-type H+-transporting ATPase subunit a [Ruminococcaceae bacterium YRB3002]